MARPGDLINPGSSEPVVYDGKIAEDASSDTDLIEVILPAFSENDGWGPCPWMPRGDTLPQRGDRCCVVLAETDTPGEEEPWIVAWWPS